MKNYVLIVEDDNDINHMLCELLGSRGYYTVSAFSDLGFDVAGYDRGGAFIQN